MPLLDFLDPEAVLPALRVNGKKQALQELAAHSARFSGLDEGADLRGAPAARAARFDRDRRGGRDSARQAARASTRMFGLVARLEKPIDFEALDGQPVDILFLLLAPEGAGADHLKALARVARVLREPGLVERIRATREANALYAVMTQTRPPPRHRPHARP